MKLNKSTVIFGVIGLVSCSLSAPAQVALTGTQLQGLSYTTSGAPFNSVSPTSAYVATGGGYANLFTPDGNISTDLATVTVPNGYDGVSLGNLNSLIAAGAAGQVSFNLLSVPIANGQSPFWVVNIKDPNSGAIMQFVALNADPDKTSGQPTLGKNPFNQGDSVMALNSPQLGNLDALWSVVAGDTVDGTQLGTWAVTSIGVEVGGQNTTAQLDVEISEIDLPGGVPDGGSTLGILGAALAGIALARRKFGI